MSDSKDTRPIPPALAARPDALRLVEDALARMRFGAINLTVHDGKIVQLDITERKRFSA